MKVLVVNNTVQILEPKFRWGNYIIDMTDESGFVIVKYESRRKEAVSETTFKRRIASLGLGLKLHDVMLPTSKYQVALCESESEVIHFNGKILVEDLLYAKGIITQ